MNGRFGGQFRPLPGAATGSHRLDPCRPAAPPAQPDAAAAQDYRRTPAGAGWLATARPGNIAHPLSTRAARRPLLRPALHRLRLCLLPWLALLPLVAAAQPAAFHGLALQDHRLQAVSARTLAGKPMLLNFVFAGCTTVCPGQLLALQQLREMLPPAVRAELQIVSVTVDPLSDTPQALGSFARARGLDLPGWRFVSGSPTQVHRLLDRMQVFAQASPASAVATAARPPAPRPDPADHRTALYLFAADGQLIQRFRGHPIDLPRLQAEITALSLPAR